LKSKPGSFALRNQVLIPETLLTVSLAS
jgi:hypothetical protein